LSHTAPTAPDSPSRVVARTRGPVARLCHALALAGGALLIATALLSTVSVLRRWLLSDPIPGDFELIQIGAGLAVFGCLAYGTALRSNIIVDTFTLWLPPRLNDLIDALWNLVWAAVALFLAERMLRGSLETRSSGTLTMVLALPTWWAIGLGALAFAVTALAAAAWTLRLARGR
jgi:TRAP-type C4-dicarboxylate transport system permease small subunit